MRTSRRLLTLVGAAALLLAPLAASGAVIQAGGVCGNGDTCAGDDFKCYANVCISSIPGDAVGIPEGAANRCSASDCCLADLACVQLDAAEPAVCVRTNDALNLTTILACDGVPGGAPNLDDGAGPITNSTIPDGTGASCSAQQCCPNDLVCYELGQVCGPVIESAPTIACTPGVGGSEDNGVPSDNGSDCGNTEETKCSDRADLCLANYCISPPIAGVNAVYGLGNRCSEDDCCPNNLACSQDIKRCSIQVGGLSWITCKATGAASSGQTVGPQTGNPQPINAASGLQASPLTALLLAAAVGLAKLW